MKVSCNGFYVSAFLGLFVSLSLPSSPAYAGDRSREIDRGLGGNLVNKQLAPHPSEQNQDNLQSIADVSQLLDVRPNDWAWQALISLISKYETLASDRDKDWQHQQGMTRYEFALTLQDVMATLQQSVETQTLDRGDLSILQRLQQEFASELAILNPRSHLLSNRLAVLEDRQFSPTTTLSGEAILAISDDFGGEAGDNLAFQYRTQLSLRTSFSGEDRLKISLRSGNFESFSYVENLTNEGRLGFDTDTNNRVELSDISYRFPLGDRASLFIAPQGDDIDASNPFFSDRGTGSISRFGRKNPIYRLVESGGIGLEYEASERLTLGLGYYNPEIEDSEAGDGLFQGDYSLAAKLAWEPTDTFQVGLLYIRSYNDSNLATGTGSIRSQLDLDRPIVANSYGLEVSWQPSPHLVLGGWWGFSDATVIDLGQANIWNYALTVAFPDLGKEGNLLGLIVGQEPKLSGTSGFLVDGSSSDRDTSLHLEAFYRHHLSDNLTVTPGFIWITAPDHNNDNPDLTILTIRTTLEF